MFENLSWTSWKYRRFTSPAMNSDLKELQLFEIEFSPSQYLWYFEFFGFLYFVVASQFFLIFGIGFLHMVSPGPCN